MEIRAVVLDLEGTLFSSKAMTQAHMLRVLGLLSRKMRISEEKALELLRSKREKLAEELNYTPPLTRLVEALGISRQQLYDEIGKVDPCDYLKPDARLQKTLKVLKTKGLKLALLTNAGYEYMVRILGALDIDVSVFDCTVTGNDVVHVKPHAEPFYRVHKSLNVDPQQILMVGDRVKIDLWRAKRLTWKTALISKHRTLHINREYIDVVFHEVYDLVDVRTRADSHGT